jgi:RHS repeat-associated protein
VKKVASGATAHYVWQGGQVIAEHNGSSGAVITDYIYFGNRMIAREQNSNRHFFLYDQLSARATITDGQGGIAGRQAHLPFGEELNATGTTDKHRFTSYERDSETGLDYAVNRQYESNVGRFTRPDPYKASGSPSNPQSLNRYTYVQNDSVNSVDPLGLWAWIPACPSGYTKDGAGGMCVPIYTGGVSAAPTVPSLWGPLSLPGLDIDIDIEALEKAVGSPVDWLSNALVLGLGPGCEQFFGGEDHLKKLASEIKGDITVVAVDGPGFKDQIPNGPETFKEFWERRKAPLPAATTVFYNFWNGNLDAQVYKSIILGPAFFDPGKYDSYGFGLAKDELRKYQAYILVHEYMHILNNADDELLAKRWGLGDKGYDVSDRISASNSITRFLANDCKANK